MKCVEIVTIYSQVMQLAAPIQDPGCCGLGILPQVLQMGQKDCSALP
jgi:hypothetical protein